VEDQEIKTMNKNKLRYAGIVLALCLLSSLLTYMAVRAVSPTTTFTLTSGMYPGAPSFTIWNESSNYFAKDASGLIFSSGTNLTQVIQSCLTQETELYFKRGTYYITANLSTNFALLIRGEQGCAIYISNAVTFLTVNTFTWLRIYNLYIEHLGTTGGIISAPNGLKHGLFKDLVVEGKTDGSFAGTGFYIRDNSYEVIFESCSINNLNTLLWYSGSELVVSNCKFGAAISNTVRLSSVGNLAVSNTCFEATRLFLESCDAYSINNIWFTSAKDWGMYLYECVNGTITNIRITDIGLSAQSWAYGIQLYRSNHTVIVGGFIAAHSTTQAQGIREYGADYNTIVSIDTFYCSSLANGIKTEGANTKVNLCWNATNWVP
jgi:hypothetical protein